MRDGFTIRGLINKIGVANRRHLEGWSVATIDSVLYLVFLKRVFQSALSCLSFFDLSAGLVFLLFQMSAALRACKGYPKHLIYEYFFFLS